MNINDLFDFEGHCVILSKAALAIPVFRTILDSNINKEKALKEIEYIILQNHWETPYQQRLDLKDRSETIKQDLFNDKQYELSEIAKISEKRYIEEFQTTEMLQLVNAARIGIKYCIDSFRSLETDKTVPPKEVFQWLKDVGNVAKSFDTLEKLLKTSGLGVKVRGEAEMNLMELPHNEKKQ